MEIPHAVRTIDCPIDWCVGYLEDHGAGGDAPDEWMHSDGDGTELGCDGYLYRWRRGSEHEQWELAIDGAIVLRADSPTDIAEKLRLLAIAIEEGRAA